MDLRRTLIIDNGAGSIKIGTEDGDCRIVPNCLVRARGATSSAAAAAAAKRTYVGAEIAGLRDKQSLAFKRPFEKGYLTNWDLEKAVWDQVIEAEEIDPTQSALIVTEPPLNMPHIVASYDQMIFEEYGFESCYRCLPGALFPYSAQAEAASSDAPSVGDYALVIDSGFSFTHIYPVVKGKVETKAIRRVDIGGKLLTNYLKEIISYRHYNVMDETWLVNDIKEKCCFVSVDMAADLDAAKSREAKIDFVLPDYTKTLQGYVRTDEAIEDHQVLTLTNERFIVPELLFRPSDIGLTQGGIPEAFMECVRAMPSDMQTLLVANTLVIGGNSNIPGFYQRLQKELRKVVPEDWYLQIYHPNDPTTYAWQSGAHLAALPEQLAKLSVSRQDYFEHGSRST